MKHIFRISILINIIVLCYVLIQFFSDKTYERLSESENIIDSIPAKEESLVATTSQNDVATCDTTLLIRQINYETLEEKLNYEKIPQSWIGKGREEILELITMYLQSVSLEDRRLGLVSMEMTSFSTEKIEVTKTYNKPKAYCCIIVSGGYLTIMDANTDKELFKTNISLYSLDEGLKKEIMDGKYMYSQQELYNFLESYSS